ncbi:hypothetical protein CYK37_24705 [Mesorhizobium loti]|nr:hypothetical protein [Mesorhizobium loti]PLP56639.1 hypothetical protein CYK37_24705 [Mesorhizobium loti]
MYIDYQYLLAGVARPLHYRAATASHIERLLGQAKGCVVGRQGGHPFIDINVDGISHRVKFDRDADLKQVLARVEALEIPVYRDREVALAILILGAVLMLAITVALCLRL